MAQHNYIECLFVNNTQSEYDNCWRKKKKKMFWYWNNMWKNTFIMPIIAKMLITLITSVDMFICTCTFSSVPSTKCDVYFVFFFLFITQTTPICNQKGEKSKKKKHPRSFSRWLEERLCLHVFVYFLPPFCSHSRFYRPLP